MPVLTIVCFAVAAAVGLTAAIAHLSGRTPGIPVALIHGLFAATGLILVISLVLRSPMAGLGMYALISFLVAAVGGFILFSFHVRKKTLPRGLIVGHGLLAVAGFVLLLLWVL
ncbi:MAG: hypothetical protein JST22_05330 [Bacteroidetes bacterium]|nr:hypothetical protein [Bacteroidota bacterium]